MNDCFTKFQFGNIVMQKQNSFRFQYFFEDKFDVHH